MLQRKGSTYKNKNRLKYWLYGEVGLQCTKVGGERLCTKNNWKTHGRVWRGEEKVAESCQRRLCTVRPFFLRFYVVIKKKKRRREDALPFSIHMWASISRSAAPREWFACRLKDPRHGHSDGSTTSRKLVQTIRSNSK